MYFLFSGIYLTCTMAITTLSMVLTVFVLNLHHVTDRPVPLWLHRLVLVYVAKLVGKCSNRSTINGLKVRKIQHDLLLAHDLQKDQPTDGTSARSSRRRAQIRIMHSVDDRECSSAIVEIREPTSADSGVTAVRENGTQEATNGRGSRTASQCSEKPDDENADFSKDWKKLAEVFDRLFFWFFLLAILISTLVLFHPLTDSYMKRVT